MYEQFSVIDCETDGDDLSCTKIHCLCITTYDNGVYSSESITDYDKMKSALLSTKLLVGHNIIGFDIPVFLRILGVDLSKIPKFDSLGLSWYLYPERPRHGLESWGETFGIEKPKIDDWKNLTETEYIHRCEEDVKINLKLFLSETRHLAALYGSMEKAVRFVGYLMFKLECSREQYDTKWKLNVPLTETNLSILTEKFKEKEKTLIIAMPKKTTYKMVSRPKTLTKKDGTPSVAGAKWLETLKAIGYPEYHLNPVRVVDKIEDGNPKSPQQLKDWLFSLGWQPDEFVYEREDDGSLRPIPQITVDGSLSESVKLLQEKEPAIGELDEFYILKHRVGLLKGFLKNVDQDGYLRAKTIGFTNTLRFQHSIIVNLPTTPKPYWEMVRGCLTCPEGMELCGSDMSSLEDNTKRHYMYYFDPDYVKEQTTYGFDAHCDIAVLSGAMSKDEETFYKYMKAPEENLSGERILQDYYDENIPIVTRMKNSVTGLSLSQLLSLSDNDRKAVVKKLKPIRLKSKRVNFAGVYGAGPKKISLTAGISFEEAKKLHSVYWERNRAAKLVAANTIVKKVGNQMWLFNPLSRFWYSLRADKDRFSTLNQSSGVYCFDTWIRYIRNSGIKLCGQFHDECIFTLYKHQREEVTRILREAIDATNRQLKLNVTLGISIAFGDTYANIH